MIFAVTSAATRVPRPTTIDFTFSNQTQLTILKTLGVETLEFYTLCLDMWSIEVPYYVKVEKKMSELKDLNSIDLCPGSDSFIPNGGPIAPSFSTLTYGTKTNATVASCFTVLNKNHLVLSNCKAATKNNKQFKYTISDASTFPSTDNLQGELTLKCLNDAGEEVAKNYNLTTIDFTKENIISACNEPGLQGLNYHGEKTVVAQLTDGNATPELTIKKNGESVAICQSGSGRPDYRAAFQCYWLK